MLDDCSRKKNRTGVLLKLTGKCLCALRSETYSSLSICDPSFRRLSLYIFFSYDTFHKRAKPGISNAIHGNGKTFSYFLQPAAIEVIGTGILVALLHPHVEHYSRAELFRKWLVEQ